MTKETSITISGNVTGNVTTATLVLNGTSHSITVTDGGFSVPVDLVEGKNMLVVKAYAAGHPGESAYLGSTGIITLFRDTTAPVINIENPRSGQTFDTPNCVISGTIYDNLFNIGTAVNITVNGSSYPVPTSLDSFGRVFFSYSAILQAGINNVSIAAEDVFGNSCTNNFVVYYDNSKTEIIVSGNGLAWWPFSNFDVTGFIHDTSITSVDLTLNGATQQINAAPLNAGEEWAYFAQTVTLVSGTNTIVVSSGNASSGNVTIYYDNIAPVLSVSLSEPADSIEINVTSNELLKEAPAVSVNASGL